MSYLFFISGGRVLSQQLPFSKVALLDVLIAAIFNMRIMNAHSFKENNMQRIFDENATKKPTNLSVNSDLLSKARKQKINLSATLEHALESELRKVERENWLNNNKKAIDSLNKLVEENGLFSDKYRIF